MTAIDIMMPFYGDSSLMREAVGSVIAQSDPSWRLTVVDDAAPDRDPGAWITSLNHPRITYHRNGRNLGVNGNFSQCLGKATADYVVFMGCDDVMLPHYVSRMRATIAQHPDAAIIQPGVSTIDGSGRQVTGLADRVKWWLAGPHHDKPRGLSGERLVSSLLRGNWCYFPSLCWKRKAIAPLGFRNGLEVVLDLALIVDVAFGGGSLVVDPEVTFEYRRHSNSVSSRLAHTGYRFDEERHFFTDAARKCRGLGWSRAAFAADLRATSRLHAASLIPQALAHRQPQILAKLIRHLLLA